MKILIFIAVWFVGMMGSTALYAQERGKEKTDNPVIHPSNAATEDTTVIDPSQVVTTRPELLVISPANRASYNGIREWKGQRYNYAATPIGNSQNRFNVVIRSFMEGNDFGNWKQFYNGLMIVEDLSADQQQYKMRLYHFKNSGYTWEPVPGSFLEATFDLKDRTVTYNAIGKMEDVFNKGVNNTMPLEGEDWTVATMMETTLQHFTEYYRTRR